MSRQSFDKKVMPSSAAPAQSAPMQHAPSKAAAAPGVEIKSSPDAVRKRAYELYMERTAKGRPGDAKTDWIQAERELKK